MLDIAWHSPFMPEFSASLPLSATDGTLRNRFVAVGMQGRIRLKTGRLDDVSGLAGFVDAASGKTFVVVIFFINHPNTNRRQRRGNQKSCGGSSDNNASPDAIAAMFRRNCATPSAEGVL
jgi:D-alanyl-D-alanine carboxypeptidase